MKKSHGYFLPNCEEIAEAVRRARIFAYKRRAICEDDCPLTFNIRTGEFEQFASAEGYASHTNGKPVVRIPYWCSIDAREIAKDFRGALQRLYTAIEGMKWGETQ